MAPAAAFNPDKMSVTNPIHIEFLNAYGDFDVTFSTGSSRPIRKGDTVDINPGYLFPTVSPSKCLIYKGN